MSNGLYSLLKLYILTLFIVGCGAPPDIQKLISGSDEDKFTPAVKINLGATHTNSTAANLAITYADIATQMYLTTDSTCETGGTWEPVAATKSWTLPNANAANTIYLKLGNGTEESTCVSASIIHDNILPTLTISTPLISGYANSTNASNFTVGGTCSESAGIQVTGSATGTTTCSGGSWVAHVNISGASDGPVSLTAAIVDLATNVGAAPQTVNFQKDIIAPSGTSISINSGAVATSVLSSTLTLAASGATDMYITNTSGCGTGGVYETYATSKVWSLATANVVDTVYVKFKDAAGNETACISDAITHSDIVPTIVITVPAVGTWINLANKSSFPISGTCSANGQNVVLSGAVSATLVCTAGVWATTANLSALSDGTNSVSIAVDHSSISGIPAIQVLKTLSKDTVAPAPITISSPATSPFTSNGATLTISGSCETNAVVSYSGAGTGTATCVAGSFSVVVSKAVDGNYTYNFIQTDPAGNASSNIVFTWNKSSLAPSPPAITLPAVSPYYSALSSVTVSGNCVTGNLVTLAGNVVAGDVSVPAGSLTQVCAGNVFSYVINKSVDGTYNFQLTQTDTVNALTSSASSTTWIRDTTVPTLTFTNPINGTWVNLSNQAAFFIGGSCSANGQNVVVTGAINSTVVCTGGAWTATGNVAATSDGVNSVSITVNHSSISGVPAIQVQRDFSKDTIAPAAIVISAPATSPFTSAGSSLTISGSCETAATIQYTNAETGTVSCAAGSFSFTANKAVDSTYIYSFTQTDAAGNVSTAMTVTWNRDSVVPTTPTITLPAVNPYYSNTNSVTLSGACVTGDIVNLGGDLVASDVTAPAGLLAQNCMAGIYSFTIQKSIDGPFILQVSQTNPANSLTSAIASTTWIRDTVAPTVPVISSPATNPYTSGGNLTLAGTCETNATVSVSGSATMSVLCVSSAFSFSIVKASDATYNFSVTQTDEAGNISAGVSQQWVRNSSALPAPIITVPTATPYLSKTTSLVVSGTCVTGYTVAIATGALASEITSPANSLTKVCIAGAFSFTISKAIDATYNFTFTQTDTFSVSSPTAPQQWVRDTTAPNTTIVTSPLNPNSKLTGTFTFSSNEVDSTFECRVDTGTWTSCSTPQVLSGLSNANHTYEIRAIDPAGNVDATPASYSWTQAAYNAVALYHFTAGTNLVDSSSYTSTLNNPLTNNGSATTASGKFADGRSLASASSNSLSAASSNSFAATNGMMTVEMWVKHATLPANGNYQVYASKSSTTVGNIGWEFGVKRQGANYRLYFSSSVDAGATRFEVVSGSNCNGVSTTTVFTHVVVTWNKGNIAFYCDGVAAGTGTNGTVGSATLNNSSAAFQLGTSIQSGSYGYFNGILDEVRVSQIVRWSTAFTPTASQYTAD